MAKTGPAAIDSGSRRCVSPPPGVESTTSRNYVRGAEDTPKSHRARSVPLADQAVVALDRLSRRANFTGPDDLVFGTVVGGHRHGDDVRDAFYDALNEAGLAHMRAKDDPIVFHGLRHTFGTLAVRSAPVTDVQHWMGHADLATMMRIVHYVPQHDNAARLSAAFAASTGERSTCERDPLSSWPQPRPQLPELSKAPVRRWARSGHSAWIGFEHTPQRWCRPRIRGKVGRA
jgi:hypothetical protein